MKIRVNNDYICDYRGMVSKLFMNTIKEWLKYG